MSALPSARGHEASISDDFSVTTPLLLLELLLSSGMPLGDIVMTIFMDVSDLHRECGILLVKFADWNAYSFS